MIECNQGIADRRRQGVFRALEQAPDGAEFGAVRNEIIFGLFCSFLSRSADVLEEEHMDDKLRRRLIGLE